MRGIKTKLTIPERAQQIVAEYREAGQPWPASAKRIARWAINNRKWKRHSEAAVTLCALDISKGMRQEYYTDPQNRRVRVKLSARFRRSGGRDGTDTFETLWGDVRSADRDFAEVGFSNRRAQMAGEAKQYSTDISSYNDNCNPGEPIEVNVDFTDDVSLFSQPTVYKHGRVA